MTFDLDLWPTDLNINRGHLLIKKYLPTKFEASGTKCSWVISCTRGSRLAWPLTLTFYLLTWISIGVIYSSRTIYLPSLKLLGQSVVELSVAQGLGLPTYRPTDIPTDMCKAICPSFFKGGHNKVGCDNHIAQGCNFMKFSRGHVGSFIKYFRSPQKNLRAHNERVYF